MSAREVACAHRHRTEQVQKCMEDVNQYHKAEEKKRSDAAAATEKRLQEQEADSQRKASATAERKERDDTAASQARKRKEEEETDKESADSAAAEEASQASVRADRTVREAEEKLSAQKLARHSELDASRTRQSTSEATVPVNQSGSIAAPGVKEDTKAEDALEQMVDPFETGGKSKPKKSRADVQASSSATSELVDPFPSGEAKTSSRGTLEESAGILGDLVEQREKNLDHEISVARRELSPSQLRRYLEEARAEKSALNGIKKMVTGAEYGVLITEVLKTEDSHERTQAEGKLGLKFASDLASKPFTKMVGKLFGEQYAGVLLGPVGWVATDVLSSTEERPDPVWVLHDDSGRSTPADKKQALCDLWQQYDRYGDHWSRQQVVDLLRNTDAIDQQ